MKTLISLLCAVVLLACGPREGFEPEPAEHEDALIDPSSPFPPRPPPLQPVGAVTLTTLSPNLAPVGTVVTVNGTNLFQPGAVLRPGYKFSLDANYVSVNTLSSTQLQVTVPVGSRGGTFCAYNRLSNQAFACTSSWFAVELPRGKIRVNNNAQVAVLGATFNGIESLAPSRIESGTFQEWIDVLPGNYTHQLRLGFGPAAGPAAGRQVCLRPVGSVQVFSNNTGNVNVPQLTAADMLSHCSTVDYNADFFDGFLRRLTLRLNSVNNTWQLFEGNTSYGSGTIATTIFNNNSAWVTFRLTGAGWNDINVGYPYATFIAGSGAQLFQFVRATNW